MKNKIYSVSGYGWSGSGLVVDILSSNELGKIYGSEFTLISEPDGLIDLYNNLVLNPHFIKSGIAIEKFFAWAEKNSSKKSVLNPFGLGLDENQSFHFSLINYYNGLVGHSYLNRTRINMSLDSKIMRLIRLASYRLFNLNKRVHLLPAVEESDFLELTHKFLEAVLCLEDDSVILDQAIPASNYGLAKNILPKGTEFFVIDRDPRDVYVDLKQTGGLIGAELKLESHGSIRKFIDWYKWVRKISDYQGIATKLNFENLVLNEGSDRAELCRVCNVDLFNSYDTSNSRKNVGMWRQIQNKDIFTEIKNSINYPYLD